jgi:hypothetical protein
MMVITITESLRSKDILQLLEYDVLLLIEDGSYILNYIVFKSMKRDPTETY